MVGWCGSSSCLQFLRQRKLRVPATSDSFAVWILEIHDETRTFVSMFVEAHVGGGKRRNRTFKRDNRGFQMAAAILVC